MDDVVVLGQGTGCGGGTGAFPGRPVGVDLGNGTGVCLGGGVGVVLGGHWSHLWRVSSQCGGSRAAQGYI